MARRSKFLKWRRRQKTRRDHEAVDVRPDSARRERGEGPAGGRRRGLLADGEGEIPQTQEKVA